MHIFRFSHHVLIISQFIETQFLFFSSIDLVIKYLTLERRAKVEPVYNGPLLSLDLSSYKPVLGRHLY